MEQKTYTLGTTEINVVLDLMNETKIYYTSADGLIHELLLKTIVPQRYSRYIGVLYNDRLKTTRGVMYQQQDIEIPSESMFYSGKDIVSTKAPLEALERMAVNEMMFRLTGLYCMDSNLDFTLDLFNESLTQEEIDAIAAAWTFETPDNLTEIEI